MTRRGQDLLEFAQAVVVDDLVSPRLIPRRDDCRIFFVGKRGPGASEGPHAKLSQQNINRLLIKLARQGLRVVRLKGGDPFVFGRGTEEVEALRAAGVPYQVVPGVSSASAALAYAGIPVTDRRKASQVTWVTGHAQEHIRADAPDVDWQRLSPRGTLIFYMAVGSWRFIQRKLLQNGWPKTKPVAAVEWATNPRQRVLLSTLEKSPSVFRKRKLIAPAIIVVGEVVHFAREISWLAREKPLFGRTVVVTRPMEQNAELRFLLEDRGAEVIVAPTIRIEPIADDPHLIKVSEALASGTMTYDWLLFLSANGVDSFTNTLPRAARRPNVRVCAVGPQTKKAAQKAGWRVHRMAKSFNSNGVLAALGNVRGKRVLIPRVQNGPPELIRALEKRGAHVHEVGAYRTLAERLSDENKQRALRGVDAITFTSGSTARHFLDEFTPAERKKIFSRAVAASIGPKTTAELKNCGVRLVLQTAESTAEGLAHALVRHFQKT